MSSSNSNINHGEKPKPRNRTMFGLGPDSRRARAQKASKEGIKKAANSDFGQDQSLSITSRENTLGNPNGLPYHIFPNTSDGSIGASTGAAACTRARAGAIVGSITGVGAMNTPVEWQNTTSYIAKTQSNSDPKLYELTFSARQGEKQMLVIVYDKPKGSNEWGNLMTGTSGFETFATGVDWELENKWYNQLGRNSLDPMIGTNQKMESMRMFEETSLTFEYAPDEFQPLKIEVLGFSLGIFPKIKGVLETDLKSIISAPNKEFTAVLKSTTVNISVAEVTSNQDIIEMQFAAKNLDKKDSVFLGGKSDPFMVISR